MVYVMMHRDGHSGICTINAGTGSIDEMLNTMMAAPLKDVGETDNIALNIGKRIFDGVAHAGLSSKVHNALRLVTGKTIFQRLSIGKIHPQMCVVGVV